MHQLLPTTSTTTQDLRPVQRVKVSPTTTCPLTVRCISGVGQLDINNLFLFARAGSFGLIRGENIGSGLFLLGNLCGCFGLVRGRARARPCCVSYDFCFKVLNPGQMIALPEGYYNGNRIMANSRNIGTVTFHLPEKNTQYENVTLTADVGHTILGMVTDLTFSYMY